MQPRVRLPDDQVTPRVTSALPRLLFKARDDESTSDGDDDGDDGDDDSDTYSPSTEYPKTTVTGSVFIGGTTYTQQGMYDIMVAQYSKAGDSEGLSSYTKLNQPFTATNSPTISTSSTSTSDSDSTGSGSGGGDGQAKPTGKTTWSVCISVTDGVCDVWETTKMPPRDAQETGSGKEATSVGVTSAADQSGGSGEGKGSGAQSTNGPSKTDSGKEGPEKTGSSATDETSTFRSVPCLFVYWRIATGAWTDL